MSMRKLFIFDFDGTLFDTRDSISHAVQLTFKALLPDNVPQQAEINRLIARGAGLIESFRTYHPEPEVFDKEQAKWITKYREVYATEGQLLVKPFPRVNDLLKDMVACGHVLAVVSNKGVTAIKALLKHHNLDHYIPDSLVIGDNTPGALQKPNPASFTDVIMPALRMEGVIASEAVVVGDTVTDLQFAKNIGAEAWWCKYGYGDHETCKAMNPEVEISAIKDIGILAREKALPRNILKSQVDWTIEPQVEQAAERLEN